jgi:hypothetical protein
MKQVKIRKCIPAEALHQLPGDYFNARALFRDALKEGKRVVFVDKSAFTYNTYYTKAWTPRNANIELGEN